MTTENTCHTFDKKQISGSGSLRGSGLQCAQGASFLVCNLNRKAWWISAWRKKNNRSLPVISGYFSNTATFMYYSIQVISLSQQAYMTSSVGLRSSLKMLVQLIWTKLTPFSLLFGINCTGSISALPHLFTRLWCTRTAPRRHRQDEPLFQKVFPAYQKENPPLPPPFNASQ